MRNEFTTLAIQSFGRQSEYKRALLTILSYYGHTTLPISETQVILFTDNPDFFSNHLKELPVDYVFLSQEKIKAMRGSIDFLHRMKIALIEEAFKKAKGCILYADSDTFFIDDPSPYMQQLNPSKSFMHKWEYRFEDLRTWKLPSGRTFIDFLNLIESQSFQLANGQKIKITPGHSSWNAGVMLLHHKHKDFISDVYALTDQFYPSSWNHASEQYAFSVILQERTEIQPCEAMIYHYWYRVEKVIMDQFLGRKINNEWIYLSLQQKISLVKDWTRILPDYIEKHELMIQDHAIQAFNEERFPEGYRWVTKALLQKPFSNSIFWKDTFYHLKRHLTKKLK